MSEIIHFGKTGKKESLLQRIQEESAHRSVGLCGGRGVCGKCRVRFLTGTPLPSFADRKIFTPKELREGWRLACTARPETDCDVEICFEKDMDLEILSAYGENRGTDRTEMSEIWKIQENCVPGLFCAVDLGTTTVVMQLVERESGKIQDSYTFQNPGRIYGVDVLSRIQAALEGKGRNMQNMLLEELERGLLKMSGAGEPEEIVFAGNTTMEHILLGYSVEQLGTAPFRPGHRGFSHFDIKGCPALFLPGISAFVGADIVAGMYACGMGESREVTLFVDLGTNGELAIGNREKILCSATAAGCAFEGDVSANMPGTDITALAADMLEQGVMDETGWLVSPQLSAIDQQAVRGLQMAKAAVCAGILSLTDHYKKDTGNEGRRMIPHRALLAGGFGYFLNIKKAERIGLFPSRLTAVCKAVGNTSLAGAIRYGRSGGDERARKAEEERICHLVKISQSINLAGQEDFEEKYVAAMNFGKVSLSL